MLGCAFFWFLLLALCGVVSRYVPLVIVLLWVGKTCLIVWLDENWCKKEAEAIEPGMGKEIMHLRMQSYFEAYTPLSLAEGVRFKVIVQGTDSYLHRGDYYATLDAVYLMGGGQYSRHQGLLLDGKLGVPFEEDPSAHCYSFLYTGTGRQLSILLRIPQGHRTGHGGPIAEGPLQVSIRTLSAAEEMQVTTSEDERQREAEAMQREEWNRRALELAMTAHLENNFLKPEYQQNYAAKHTARILNTWRDQWLAEYLALLSNGPLYELVQIEHPHVLEFFEARFEVVRLAQRLAVEPIPPPPAPEPKRKLTREEWEARIERYRQRQLDRMRVGADDRIAQMLERFESVRRLRERAEASGLEEDEIEQLERQLLEDLNQDEDDQGNGYRQL